VDGERKKLPLSELRRRYEEEEKIDTLDFGGCGCFIDTEDDQLELL
jgi:hypothetical protein